MKLRAGRKYKNDLSDIIGILAEHEKRGQPITFEMVDTAVQMLYGGWSDFPACSKEFVADAIKAGDYENIYASVNEGEKQTKSILLRFENEYPHTANDSNVNEILAAIKAKSDREKNVEAETAEIIEEPEM